MSTVKRVATTSIGAAVIGGLIVGILGWIAIAAGWIHSSGNDTTTIPALSRVPSSQPTSQQSSGKGLSVNQIYKQDAPGVAFVQAQTKPQPSSLLNPFGGGSGGGTATGSGFVIDHEGHVLTNAHVVEGATNIPGHPRPQRFLTAGERSGRGQGSFDRRRPPQGERAG